MLYGLVLWWCRQYDGLVPWRGRDGLVPWWQACRGYNGLFLWSGQCRHRRCNRHVPCQGTAVDSAYHKGSAWAGRQHDCSGCENLTMLVRIWVLCESVLVAGVIELLVWPNYRCVGLFWCKQRLWFYGFFLLSSLSLSLSSIIYGRYSSGKDPIPTCIGAMYM